MHIADAGQVPDLVSPTESEWHARLLEQRCCYPKCDAPPADGSAYCDPHWADAKERSRRSKERRRLKRWRANQCGECGSPRKPDVPCPVCRIKKRSPYLSTISVNNGVNKAARIAARTRVESTPNGEYGRTRYHGQSRRGQQPRSQLDAQDFAEAMKRLDIAAKGMALRETPEVQAMGRISRDSVVREALGEAQRAVRIIEEIEDRHKEELRRR